MMYQQLVLPSCSYDSGNPTEEVTLLGIPECLDFLTASSNREESVDIFDLAPPVQWWYISGVIAGREEQGLLLTMTE